MKPLNSTPLSQARSKSPLLLREKVAAATASESFELLSKITGLAFNVELLAHPYLVVSSLSALTEEQNETAKQNGTQSTSHPTFVLIMQPATQSTIESTIDFTAEAPVQSMTKGTC